MPACTQTRNRRPPLSQSFWGCIHDGYIHDVISYFLFLMIKEEEEVPLDI